MDAKKTGAHARPYTTTTGAHARPYKTTDLKLDGAAAVVTGASRGLGRALALRLAREGARVVLVASDAAALTRVRDEIRAAGGEAHAVPDDVGEPGAAERVLGVAAALVGPVDVLVHAAATLGPVPMPLLADLAAEDLERALAVNLLGPFRLTRAAVGGMVLRGRGVVLAVSSDAAVEAYPGWGAYSVTKAALERLAAVWARELDASGVRVLTVDPGEMDTDMHRAALPDADPATLARPDDVARALVGMIVDGERAPSGARLRVATWEA